MQPPIFKSPDSQSASNQNRSETHTRGSAVVKAGKGEIFSAFAPVDINLTHSVSDAYRQPATTTESEA